MADIGKGREWLTSPAVGSLFALLLAVCYCFVVPPFWGADEIAHANRAIQISQGRLLAERLSGGETVEELPDELLPDEAPLAFRRTTAGYPAFGGNVDTNFLIVANRYTFSQRAFVAEHGNVFARPNGRVSAQKITVSRNVTWKHQDVFTDFQNTGVYPPIFYFPAALAWRLGADANFTIVETLLIVRLFNVCCAFVMWWFSLRLWHRLTWPLLLMLTLPTVLAIEASCSQDALMLPVAILVAALIASALSDGRTLSNRELVFATVAMALCVAGRPPYFPIFALLFVPVLEVGGSSYQVLKRPLLASLGGILLVLFWRSLVHDAGIAHSGAAQPLEQIAFIKAHWAEATWIILSRTLLNVPGLVVRSIELLELASRRSTISLYGLHIGCLVLAMFLGTRPALKRRRSAFLVVTILVVSLGGMSVAEYIIWNSPGSHALLGLQGRYLLPLVPFALICLETRANPLKLETVMIGRTKMFFLRGSVAVYLTVALGMPFLLSYRYYNLSLMEAFRTLIL